MRYSNSLVAGLAIAGAAGLVASRLMKSRYSFAGKVVVITGGSRGLGLALARRLAWERARIALISRDRAELARAADDLHKRGAREVFTFPCDVRKKEQVEQIIREIMTCFGRLDVLINNAGTITVGPAEAMTHEDYQISMDLHFWAPLFMIEAAMPHLRESGAGRIVNIASFGGKLAVPHMTPYCASKFALVGLSEGLRPELAEQGVLVTTVCPALLRTGSHLNAFFKGDNEAEFSWFAGGIAIPGSAMSAEAAARQIVEACRKGQADLTLTLKARMAVVAQALMPNTTAKVMGVFNRFLPHRIKSRERKSGWQSRRRISGVFTKRADAATEDLNGLRGHESAIRRFST